MTPSRVMILIGIAVLVMAANVGISVLYMVIYGHVIDPGHEPQYYDDHIQAAAPYCSIVAGIPLMLLAGWWVSGFWDRALGYKVAWVVWLAYAVIDLVILLSAGLTPKMAILVAVSVITKLAAALFGARIRLGRSAVTQ